MEPPRVVLSLGLGTLLLEPPSLKGDASSF